jgi:hypothetical protein
MQQSAEENSDDWFENPRNGTNPRSREGHGSRGSQGKMSFGISANRFPSPLHTSQNRDSPASLLDRIGDKFGDGRQQSSINGSKHRASTRAEESRGSNQDKGHGRIKSGPRYKGGYVR